jgi:hypothetical protein
MSFYIKGPKIQKYPNKFHEYLSILSDKLRTGITIAKNKQGFLTLLIKYPVNANYFLLAALTFA